MKPIKHRLTDDHDEWLKQRNKGIGGSDAGAVMGLNPYKSAFTLWHEKTGKINSFVPDNEAMRFGRDMEDYVAKRFCEATGKKVARSGYSYQSKYYPWMLANIDRRVIGENAGLECKTANIFAEKIYDEGRIPDSYYCQCLHYMEVCDFDRMYLACYIPQRGLKYFSIEREDVKEDLEALIQAEAKFWKLVENDQRPEVDGSRDTKQTISAMMKEPIGHETDPDKAPNLTDMEDVIAKLTDVKAKIRELTGTKSDLENIIADRFREEKADIGFTADKKISWKEQTTTSIDGDALKADHPGLYDKYAKVSTYRVLRIGKKRVPKKGKSKRV